MGSKLQYIVEHVCCLEVTVWSVFILCCGCGCMCYLFWDWEMHNKIVTSLYSYWDLIWFCLFCHDGYYRKNWIALMLSMFNSYRWISRLIDWICHFCVDIGWSLLLWDWYFAGWDSSDYDDKGHHRSLENMLCISMLLLLPTIVE